MQKKMSIGYSICAAIYVFIYKKKLNMSTMVTERYILNMYEN